MSHPPPLHFCNIFLALFPHCIFVTPCSGSHFQRHHGQCATHQLARSQPAHLQQQAPQRIIRKQLSGQRFRFQGLGLFFRALGISTTFRSYKTPSVATASSSSPSHRSSHATSSSKRSSATPTPCVATPPHSHRAAGACARAGSSESAAPFEHRRISSSSNTNSPPLHFQLFSYPPHHFQLMSLVVAKGTTRWSTNWSGVW
jgi:hypothetical protein